MMFVITLVISFLIKLRFPPHKSLNSILVERYDIDCLRVVRNLQDIDLKLRKNSEHLKFLIVCQNNHITPKFLRFKLYNKNIRNGEDYKKYQRQLLDREIEAKRTYQRACESRHELMFNLVQSKVSWFDFKHVWHITKATNQAKVAQIRLTHDRKLHYLGIAPRYDEIESDKVIYNFSDYKLSSIQKEALALGLNFAFFPKRVRYNEFFMAAEKLFNQLKECSIFNETQDSENMIRTSIKEAALKTYYHFKASNFLNQLVA